MSEFEKALEEASEKYAIANEQATLNLERIKSANKNGARWAREFTVREICEFLRHIEYELGGIVVPRLGQTEAQAYASAIESHFKYRGGEK